MAGYSNKGTDLDNIFAARTTTKRADVDYHINGVDISNIYEDLSLDQKIPPVDYSTGSTNLSELFMGHAGQYVVTANRLTFSRTAAWTTNVDAYFTVTFSNATVANNFFLYGGRIRLSGSRTGGTSSAKNTSWTNMLNAMGTIEIGKTATYRGTTTINANGWDDLTTGDQLIYNASNTGTAPYAENDLLVYAAATSTNVLRVRVLLRDQDVGDPTIDESVNGTLSFTVDERRHPTITPAPTYTLTNGL